MKMNFKKYQKLKAMRSFRQKFSEMTKEYRSGFWDESKVKIYHVQGEIKPKGIAC